MKLDFNRKVERTGTDCVKYDGLKEVYKRSDLIPMWIADMDFPVPECVVDAIKERADHPLFGYQMVGDSFYKSIVDWVGHRHSWDISPDWIIFSPGVVPALTLSVLALTEPGDKVLLQSPVYPPFFSSIRDNHRILVNNQLAENNGKYSIDFDDLDRKLSEGVKLMFFCSPHNPVGRVWTAGEIERVAALCRKNDVILLSDEIHSDLVFPGYCHIPVGKTVPDRDNMIIAMAPSKTFNLAALASAYLIIPDPVIRDKMKKMLVNIHVHYGNAFGLVALQAAYNKGEEWLENLLRYLEGNLKRVNDFFGDELPEIEPVATEGTYLVWLDCRKTGMNDLELKRFFTEQAGVAMNPGRSFGPGGEGFFRMNIASTRETVDLALRNIKKAWSQVG